MRKIFGRKKNEQQPADEIPTLEMAAARVLNKLTGSAGDPLPSEREALVSFMDKEPELRIFQLCGNSDRFPLTVVLSGVSGESGEILHLLGEVSSLEVIHYLCTEANRASFLWRNDEGDILSAPDGSYFLIRIEKDLNPSGPQCLDISRNREFFFGKILAGDFTINNSPLLMTYDKLRYEGSSDPGTPYSHYRAVFTGEKGELVLFLSIGAEGKVIDYTAKEMIANMGKRLNDLLPSAHAIKSAGPCAGTAVPFADDFSLEGNIFTSGGTLPYRVIFPRKLINLLPDRNCMTVRGKILQTDRILFEESFSDFHRSGQNYLMTDFLSHISERDMKLVCQNFLVARSLKGSYLRRLFRYRFKLEEKSKVLRVPFPAEAAIARQLPARLREEYTASREYASSYDELLAENRELLRSIYRAMSEGKLLLSSNARLILSRETGKEMEENKMLRLKKLLSDQRFLNAAVRMDKAEGQLFFNRINHRYLSDLFVYQTDKLNLVRPFLSRNRFAELGEEIRLTQKNIRKSQLDVNRISDSIELFNKEIRLFFEKEKKI